MLLCCMSAELLWLHAAVQPFQHRTIVLHSLCLHHTRSQRFLKAASVAQSLWRIEGLQIDTSSFLTRGTTLEAPGTPNLVSRLEILTS